MPQFYNDIHPVTESLAVVLGDSSALEALLSSRDAHLLSLAFGPVTALVVRMAVAS